MEERRCVCQVNPIFVNPDAWPTEPSPIYFLPGSIVSLGGQAWHGATIEGFPELDQWQMLRSSRQEVCNSSTEGVVVDVYVLPAPQAFINLL